MISSAVTSRVRVVESPPRCSPAARVGHQPIFQIEERIAALEDLDRRVAAVGVAGDLAVVAILLDRAAGAVTIEVVVRVVGPVTGWMPPKRNCSRPPLAALARERPG